MYGVRLWVIGFLLTLSATLLAQNDSIYMGTQVKLDIASPIVVPAATKWGMQHYEVAVNVRLAQRFYPTFELGYAGGKTANDTIDYLGHGGFFRVGCDLNPLKRHPGTPHALLVGVRLGTAVQDVREDIRLQDRMGQLSGIRADCWGEIVAGCQVEICKGEKRKAKGESAFYMGWMGRFKALFTRKSAVDNYPVIYIPGYGKYDTIGWGVNYYLGWRF